MPFCSCYLATVFPFHHSGLNPPFFLMQKGIGFYLESPGDYSKVLKLDNEKRRPCSLPKYSSALTSSYAHC